MWCLNIVPIILASAICWASVCRPHSVTLYCCGIAFALSSFPIMHALKANAKITNSEITNPEYGAATWSKAKELFKEYMKGFAVAWWGFMISTFLMTFMRGILWMNEGRFRPIGAFLVAIVMLFFLFDAMVTGFVSTNMGDFRKGQFGYAVSMLIEYLAYNLVIFTWGMS